MREVRWMVEILVCELESLSSSYIEERGRKGKRGWRGKGGL